MYIEKMVDALHKLLEWAKSLGHGIYKGVLAMLKSAAENWAGIIILLMATIGGMTIGAFIVEVSGIVMGMGSLFAISLMSVAVVVVLAAI